MNPPDVIDSAAGLAPGERVHAARRFRATVVEATQASHDALLFEPVAGLTSADRLRVAAHACDAAGAAELAAHYRALLQAQPAADAPSPALPAMQHFAATLTTDPRRGDQAAIQALEGRRPGRRRHRGAGAAGGLSVVPDARGRRPEGLAGRRSPAMSRPAPAIRRNGFTNETLDWASWLRPVDVARATPLQLQVLDESHPQSRTSSYSPGDFESALKPLWLRAQAGDDAAYRQAWGCWPSRLRAY
jgi:hypothetical protein